MHQSALRNRRNPHHRRIVIGSLDCRQSYLVRWWYTLTLRRFKRVAGDVLESRSWALNGPETLMTIALPFGVGACCALNGWTMIIGGDRCPTKRREKHAPHPTPATPPNARLASRLDQRLNVRQRNLASQNSHAKRPPIQRRSPTPPGSCTSLRRTGLIRLRRGSRGGPSRRSHLTKGVDVRRGKQFLGEFQSGPSQSD
jgi:hypothetical protein